MDRVVENDGKLCKDCSWRPRGGAGGCRNKDNDGLKNRKRQVTWEDVRCSNFFEKPNETKSSSEMSIAVTAAVDEIITAANHNIKTMIDNHDMFTYHQELGYWIRDGKEIITTYCSERPIINTISARNNILMNIEGQTYCERNKPNTYDNEGRILTQGFQSSRGYINVNNGVLKLDTMDLLPFDAKYNFKNKLNINYNPKSECPMFTKFLDAIKPKNEQALIQEWFGYQLDDGMPAKALYCIVGKPNSGKSTLFYVMTSLVGKENVITQSLQDIENSTWALAEFYDKKANITPDMGTEELNDVGKLKSLTSSTDLIRGEKKNKDPFYFYNTCKITTACNKLPPISENIEYDDAFWNRVIIDIFDVTLDIHEFGGYEDFYNALTTPDELSGILNWAIEGLHRYAHNGNQFSYDRSKSKEIWMFASNHSNPVQRFYDEFLEIGESSTPVIKDYVWEKYLRWCNERGVHPLSHISFGRNLCTLSGCGTSTTNIKINDKSIKMNVYKGITWKKNIVENKKCDW